MGILGALAFLFPWLLAGLVLLPGLWWLLRVTPPRPRIVRFPAFFLLQGLGTTQRAPAKTPWWLLVLRCLLVAAFIFALAEPIVRTDDSIPGDSAPVIIAIDNGYAAAVQWDVRQERITEMLTRLGRDNRAVYVLPLAAAADQPLPQLYGAMTAAEATAIVRDMQPQPWPADHKAAAEALGVLTPDTAGHAVFFSDGTSRSALDTQELVAGLDRVSAAVEIVADTKINRPFLLRRAGDTPGETSFEIERLTAQPQAQTMTLVAMTETGALLDELRFSFPAGKKTVEVEWPLDEDLRTKIARVMLREPQMAGSVHLTDAQWRQRPVGVLAETAQKDNASFLNEVYYLRRALETDSTLQVDTLEALLTIDRAVIIWPDSAPLTAVERVRLLEWLEQGGSLIRFAGPALAANPEDALLPVRLLQGQRALEGSITWEKPLHLGPVAETSPFFGLATPEDVTVTRQVLAVPEPDTFARTWLQLVDGTPLITGGAVGEGSLTLIHTTAGPEWSNFAYSGLYVDALRRLVALSRGVTDYQGKLVLPPVAVMDGYGRLAPPAAGSLAGVVDTRADFTPGPRTPPGIYGDGQQFSAYTLGGSLSGLYALPSLSGNITRSTYDLQGGESFKNDLLKAAIVLLLLDVLATLWLRGALPIARRMAAVGVAFLLLTTSPAMADEPPDDAARSSQIYLAYVETGDAVLDEVSRRGLEALARVVSLRTSIRVSGVEGVDPEVDPLHFYPFLYWPMTEAQRGLSLTAAEALQNYSARGGMIVFDTRDLQFGDIGGQKLGETRLRDLTQSLQVPVLTPVASGHILTKSFYLLDSFPGAYAGGQVWVEKEPNPNYDGVTSVVIGGNHWAAAWSDDARDRARYPVTPGGEQQREMAYRFGVNLVMVALAGNYKADQVHVPFILERMGQ